jgi:hypothetical protein
VAGVLVGPAPPAAVRRWRAHSGTRAAWGRGRANRREGCEAECGNGRGSVQPAPAQSTEAMREVGWPWDSGRIRFAIAEEDPQKPWRWEQEVPDRLIVDGQNCRFRPSAFRRPADGPRGNCLVGRVRRSSARVPVGGAGLDRRRIGGSAEEGGEHRTRRRAPGGEACRGAVPGCVGTPSAEVAAALDERAVAPARDPPAAALPAEEVLLRWMSEPSPGAPEPAGHSTSFGRVGAVRTAGRRAAWCAGHRATVAPRSAACRAADLRSAHGGPRGVAACARGGDLAQTADRRAHGSCAAGPAPAVHPPPKNRSRSCGRRCLAWMHARFVGRRSPPRSPTTIKRSGLD